MRRSLFIEAPVVKEAAAAKKLSADPSAWQEDIIQFLLTEHPYLNDYVIDLNIKTAIPENGTLFGTINVTPKEPVPGEPKKKFAGIPIFAENWKLRPMDIFSFGGGFQPLTENRMRTVFPAVGLGTPIPSPNAGASGTNLSSFSMSPMQTMRGYDYGNTPASGEVKSASLRDRVRNAVQPSILNAISHTIDPVDVDNFVKAAGSPEVMYAFHKNAAFHEVLQRIDAYDTSQPAARIEDVIQPEVDPTVIQVRVVGDSYVVKAASAAMYRPEETIVTPAEFDSMPADVKAEVIRNGHWTIVAPGYEFTKEAASEVADVTDLVGDYIPFEKCAVFQHGEGQQEGIIMPAIVNLGTGAVTNKAIWVGDSNYSVMDKVAGVSLGIVDGDDFLDAVDTETIGGHGMFILPHADEHGEVIPVALEPMTVKFASYTDGGVEYNARTDSGRQVKLIKTAAVNALYFKNDQVLYVPEDIAWMPLGAEVSLEKSASDIRDVMTQFDTIVKVASNGSTFNLEGEAIDAVPTYERYNVDYPQAVFVLGLVGVPTDVANHTLTKAAEMHPQRIRVMFDVESPDAFEKYAHHVAQAFYESFSRIRKPGPELVKAATAVQDVNTLDAILSLGFLTPQNVEVFISHLPKLERALGYVSELLVASRLGFGVEEHSLKTCMTALDDIINDLQFISNESASQFTPSTVGTAGTSFLPTEGIAQQPPQQPQPEQQQQQPQPPQPQGDAGGDPGAMPGQAPGGGAMPGGPGGGMGQ